MRRPVALLSTLGAVLLLSGCTGGSSKHNAGGGTGAPTGDAAAPATVRTANCADWGEAPMDERWQLVRGMRAFFGGQVDTPGVYGQVMDDQKAYDLFTSYCAQSFASAFSLYRIYGNAAAFTLPS